MFDVIYDGVTKKGSYSPKHGCATLITGYSFKKNLLSLIKMLI